MTEKTKITTPDFMDFRKDPLTCQPLCAVYFIETEKRIFCANKLNEVMQLWKASDDSSEVIDIGKIG